jgi:hypothetical protein
VIDDSDNDGNAEGIQDVVRDREIMLKACKIIQGYCVEEEEGIYIHCYRKPILIGKVF